MRLRFTLQHFYNFYNEKQENKNILSCFKMYMLVCSFLFCIANSSIFRSLCVCARARGGGERIKKANVLKGFVFCVLPSTLVAFCLVSACACLCVSTRLFLLQQIFHEKHAKHGAQHCLAWCSFPTILTMFTHTYYCCIKHCVLILQKKNYRDQTPLVIEHYSFSTEA